MILRLRYIYVETWAQFNCQDGLLYVGKYSEKVKYSEVKKINFLVCVHLTMEFYIKKNESLVFHLLELESKEKF